MTFHKAKTTAPANHKGHRQSNEPMKTPSNYMKLTQSAGKRMASSHDWFWFHFWLDEKVERVFLSQSCSVVEAKPITFWHSKENRYIKIIRLLQLTLWNQSLKLTRQDRKLVWVEVKRCCRCWLLIKYNSIVNVISYVFFFCRLVETRFFSPHWIWKEIWTKSYATLKEKLPKSGLMS